MKEMVDYLKNLLPFGTNQVFPEDGLTELVGFELPRKWQKQLIVQGYELTGKNLYKLIDFCKRLKMLKEINNYKGGDTHPNNNKTNPFPDTKNPHRLARGQTRP